MTRARTNADQAHTESLSVEPHIIPGVLYPAVAGKLLDGSTSHSGAYGTAQADGYSYYYTDIKGSKPIKDPRIGGHFGSQRHKFTSLQLLEQETATEGKNIYSIDGREWLRAYTGNSEWINYYDQNGTYLQAPTDCTGNFIELTGYFNDINFAITTHSNRCDDIDISVNGTLSVDGSATLGGRTTVASPLGSRFVGMGSLINGGSTLSASLGTTPQINTVRYEMKTGSGEYVELHAIELIAQDTSSTANKSKIQIPSQNVVSYGKKFTVSGTPHYDPFNGFTSGNASAVAGLIDTATSLGYKEWTYSGNTFTDSGEHTQTITVAGTPHHTEAKSKIGASSMYFDGADDYLSIPDHADFDVGSNFTVEAWVWPQDDGNVNDSGVIWSHSNAGNDQINFSISTLGRLTFDYYKASASLDIYIASDNNKITYQAWNHVAAVRTSDVWKLYINGIESTNITNTTGTSTASVFTSSAPVRIGTRWTGSAFSLFNGYIDELRQSKVSRYSANFTPPTTAFTSDSDTALLIHSNTVGTYYRPYNGGRVVKWVDSSGTIKTSVNMMPPNATSNKGVSSNQKIASSANNIYTPTFSGSIDHSLSEVAKTYNFREFGNGAANGGTGATYADASMLSGTADDIAYVMDDGLTSLAGDDIKNSGTYFLHENDNDYFFVTFIGTGVGITVTSNGGGTDEYDKYIDGVKIVDGAYERASGIVTQETLAQNLPYGTHILKVERTAADAWNEQYEEVTFHQPKKPPIPEDAVVLADYCLFADFVKQTDAEPTEISKGVRYCNGSRDHFYSGGAATNPSVTVQASQRGLTGGHTPSGGNTGVWKLPFFGTTGLSLMEQSHGAHSITLGGSATTETALDNSVASLDDAMSIAETVTLGQTNIETTLATGGYAFHGHFVVTPIHTSSHYQTFETPFLHELVGGDRNMEQHNLVVTPDGKTWDEVTRDTSYLGRRCLIARAGVNHVETSWDTVITHKLNVRRGESDYLSMIEKDWAGAYDRYICLKDGEYEVIYKYVRDTTSGNASASAKINGSVANIDYTADANHRSGLLIFTQQFKRGDYLQITGSTWAGSSSHLLIHRMD